MDCCVFALQWVVPARRFRLDRLSTRLLIESPWLCSLVGPGGSKVIAWHFSSSSRLGSSCDLLCPVSSQVFLSGLTRVPFSIQLVPYIPWEMANCFSRAKLSRKHHFWFAPEMMTSLPVTPEVRSWTRSDDRKWYHTSGSNTGSDLVSLENHSINQQNSLINHYAAAQTLTVFERLSNKRRISLSESVSKRRTAVEKHERLWYHTHITVSCT